MTIKRFTNLAKDNEEIILDKCGCPEAKQIRNELPFYYADETTVFMFVDNEDIELKVCKDLLSYKVTKPYLNKAFVVEQIFGKDVVLFVNEGKYPNFVFYGVYALKNGYENISGAENLVNCETPLLFALSKADYVL